jgi:hypothetical protein
MIFPWRTRRIIKQVQYREKNIYSISAKSVSLRSVLAKDFKVSFKV